MADAAMFIGWNRAVTGREQQAAAFWKESLALWGALQKEGKIESYEPVLLAAHGGDLNGFVLLRGEAKKLDELRHDERYQDAMIKGAMLTTNWGSTPAFINQGLERVMARWVTLSTPK